MAARRRNRPLSVYTVHPLDVWGNAREGYDVNDVLPSQGNVFIFDDATDEEIVRALKEEDFIDKGIHTRSVSIDGERGYDLYIGEARTNKPVYELRHVRPDVNKAQYKKALEKERASAPLTPFFIDPPRRNR